MNFPLEFIEVLGKSRNIVILTGAGVSRESGLDTFRDVGGHWSRYNPYELASPHGFSSNPLLVWQWYQARKIRAAEVAPNPGHYSIAEMESHFTEYYLFTQNVDRLHKRAGSKKIFELHGSIFESHCFNCGLPYMNDFTIGDTIETIPHCPECNGLIRPSVVWFGESLPFDILTIAYDKSRSCDLFFTIGTSSEVYPAADLPHQAKYNGAYVVEINPNQTSFTRYADVSFRENSGVILPQILKIIKEIKS